MPTEKQIEAAARAMHDGPLAADEHDFDAPENAKTRAWCLDMARAALETVQPRVKPEVVLDNAIARFEADALATGSYMPALATRLRLHADALADRYPDDANGGTSPTLTTEGE